MQPKTTIAVPAQSQKWAELPALLEKCAAHEMTIDRTPYFVRVEQGNAGADVSRMDMVEVQVSDLHGTALNLAVAQAEGRKVCLIRGGAYGAPNSLWYVADLLDGRKYDPAGNWAVGGPLLDKHRPNTEANHFNGTVWACVYRQGATDRLKSLGDTYLVATCRAIVTAKLGSSVWVPAELVEVAA